MAPRLRSWPGSRRWRVADRGDRAGRSSGPVASGLHDRPLVLRGGSARPARGRGARGPRPSGRRHRLAPARRSADRHAQRRPNPAARRPAPSGRRPVGLPARVPELPGPGRLGRAAGLSQPTLSRRPGPQPARLPRVRRAPAQARRRPGRPRPPRGDAGVLPDPLPERAQPVRPAGAPAPGTDVDPVRRPRPVGQRAHGRPPARARDRSGQAGDRAELAEPRAVRRQRRIRAGHSEPTARCGSSTPAR